MWFLPSRQRPENLKRFFDAYRATGANSPGFVWLDEGDESEYDITGLPPGWTWAYMPKMKGTGEMVNVFYGLHPDEPWYGMIADDVVPITPFWDAALIEAAGSDGLAYGDDGICINGLDGQGSPLATHPVAGGDFIRSLGFIALPGTERLFMDKALTEIAERKGVLRYLPQVKMEHLHFSNGKAPFDETYEKPSAANDKRIYEEWRATLA